MKLNLSYLAVASRETGEVTFLATVSHLIGGGDVAEVAAAHEVIRGPSLQGVELRAQYSHALFVVDNEVRCTYYFPPPGEEEKRRLEAQLVAAKNAAAAADEEARKARAIAATIKVVAAAAATAQKQVEELQAKLAALEPSPEKTEPEKTEPEKTEPEKL